MDVWSFDFIGPLISQVRLHSRNRTLFIYIDQCRNHSSGRRRMPQLNVLLAIFRFSSKSITHNADFGRKIINDPMDHTMATSKLHLRICLIFIGEFARSAQHRTMSESPSQFTKACDCPLSCHSSSSTGRGLFGQSIRPPKLCMYSVVVTFRPSVFSCCGQIQSRSADFNGWIPKNSTWAVHLHLHASLAGIIACVCGRSQVYSIIILSFNTRRCYDLQLRSSGPATLSSPWWVRVAGYGV